MQAGKESFEEAWPDLARRLQGVLRARRVSPWVVDDIVQETGLRLFKRWADVDPQLSPWGLTLTIAKNLLWDTTHRRAARELLIEVPEQPASHDVENAGIARLELRRVGRAMRRMSPRHQSVLLAEIGAADSLGTSASATKMTRMRARKRLNALLESASASCFTAAGTMRRWAVDVQHVVRRSMPLFEGSASVTVAALVGAIVVIVPSTATPSPGTERAPIALDAADEQRIAHRTAFSGREVTLRRDAGDQKRSSEANEEEATEQTTHHSVSVGKGVGGSARVEIRHKKKQRGLLDSGCSVEPREEEIYAKCTIYNRDEAYLVEARAHAKFKPEE